MRLCRDTPVDGQVVAAKRMAASLIFRVKKPVSKAHMIGCLVNGGVSRGTRVNGPACCLSPQPPPRCNDVLAVLLGIISTAK